MIDPEEFIGLFGLGVKFRSGELYDDSLESSFLFMVMLHHNKSLLQFKVLNTEEAWSIEASSENKLWPIIIIPAQYFSCDFVINRIIQSHHNLLKLLNQIRKFPKA
jgi:hypothetical protein